MELVIETDLPPDVLVYTVYSTVLVEVYEQPTILPSVVVDWSENEVRLRNATVQQLTIQVVPPWQTW